MVEAVSCHSSVSQITSTVLHSREADADADEDSQQEHRVCEADDVRHSISSIDDREVRILLTSRNKHDDVRPTKHGACHPDAA